MMNNTVYLDLRDAVANRDEDPKYDVLGPPSLPSKHEATNGDMFSITGSWTTIEKFTQVSATRAEANDDGSITLEFEDAYGNQIKTVLSIMNAEEMLKRLAMAVYDATIYYVQGS